MFYITIIHYSTLYNHNIQSYLCMIWTYSYRSTQLGIILVQNLKTTIIYTDACIWIIHTHKYTLTHTCNHTHTYQLWREFNTHTNTYAHIYTHTPPRNFTQPDTHTPFARLEIFLLTPTQTYLLTHTHISSFFQAKDIAKMKDI